MKHIPQYYINSLRNISQTLSKKSILVDKPWALIDEDEEIQKLIFERDGTLILSKNGIVTEGSWKYYPAARSLKINRGRDTLLLNEQFIDDNVLILKIDGTTNKFFALANENTLPDYDIPRYLLSLRNSKLTVRPVKLIDGKRANVLKQQGMVLDKYYQFIGGRLEILNDDHYYTDSVNGPIQLDTKDVTLYLENGVIVSAFPNIAEKTIDGTTIEIELRPSDSSNPFYIDARTRYYRIFSDGKPVEKPFVVTKDRMKKYYLKDGGYVQFVANNLIIKATDNFTYEIENGYEIKKISRDDPYLNIGKKVSIEGNPVQVDRIVNPNNIIFEIDSKTSTISKIFFLREHYLSSDYYVLIEQAEYDDISKGDKIVDSNPVYPIPDGRYRVKGIWFKKITIQNCVIV